MKYNQLRDKQIDCVTARKTRKFLIIPSIIV